MLVVGEVEFALNPKSSVRALGPGAEWLVYGTGGASTLVGPSCRLTPRLPPSLCSWAVLEVVLDGTLSWLSLVMLLLWSATKAAETLWRLLKEDPSLGGRLPGGGGGRPGGRGRAGSARKSRMARGRGLRTASTNRRSMLVYASGTR